MVVITCHISAFLHMSKDKKNEWTELILEEVMVENVSKLINDIKP